MDSDTIWRHIDEQRATLADFFDDIAAARWSTPSLCAAWTVRDVAAHLTHSHMSTPRIMAEALKSGFRFNAMVHRMAVQDPSSPEQIAVALRAMRGSRRHPPTTTECDPLIDVLVHGQDIAVPLGIDLPMPADAAMLRHDGCGGCASRLIRNGVFGGFSSPRATPTSASGKAD